MNSDVKTSGVLWYCILAGWLLLSTILWIKAPYFLTFALPVLSAFILLCLTYFLLVGVFNIGINVYSRCFTSRSLPFKREYDIHEPRVAIMYCTYNDFSPIGASSMLTLTYPMIDLWILDDSTNPDDIQRIDQFIAHAQLEDHRIQILRRNHRNGFKAGAINHGIQQLPVDTKFIVIMDADEVLPPDFVQHCFQFVAPDVAFVQANHYCYNKDVSWFTEYLGIGVDLHWKHYQPYRNVFGTPHMLGHGTMIRRDVLDDLNGFPILTCEDLAFTVEARLAGYRGVFAPDILCGETFPEDFSAMRRRHLRWSWATIEFLRRYFYRIVESPLGIHEKLDILLPSLNLPTVILLLGFIVASSLLEMMGQNVILFQDPIFILMGVIASTSPLLMFLDLLSHPLLWLKIVIINTASFLALYPISIKGVAQGLVSPAKFLVTTKHGKPRMSILEAIVLTRFELGIGLMLLLLHGLTLNLGNIFSPIGLVPFLAPVLVYTSQAQVSD